MFINILPGQFLQYWPEAKGGIKKRVKFDFLNLDVKRTSQLMILLIVLMLTPLAPVENESTFNSHISFNAHQASALSTPEVKTEISIGRSNLAYEEEKSTGIAHNDPADFRALYMAAGERFNIPWQLIEAVHQVESGKSGSTNKRSYAGAVGPMQFMPGTWRAYAVDGNNDGTKDITDATDAIYTAANYLAKSGADEGRFEEAVFNYNHSNSYVRTVVSIAQEIGLPKIN